MMLYEFLVIAEERPGEVNKKGRISHFKLAGGEWGSKEVPPRFNIITYDCTEKEAKHIFHNCKYSFTNSEFIYKKLAIGDTFEKADVLINDNAYYKTEGETKNNTLAKILNNNVSVADSCGFLTNFLSENIDNPRKYWYEKFFTLRKEEGVIEIMNIASCGYWGQLFEAINNLELSVKDKIKASSSFSVEDIKLLQDKWGVL
jgi:hypothetical protein